MRGASFFFRKRLSVDSVSAAQKSLWPFFLDPLQGEGGRGLEWAMIYVRRGAKNDSPPNGTKTIMLNTVFAALAILN